MNWPFTKKTPQITEKQISIPSAPIIEALGKIKPSFRNIKNRAEYTKVFSEVSEVYSVIMYMARAFSNMRVKLFDVNKNEEIPSHEVLDWLKQPNPLSDWTSFLINHFVNKKVQGNSYIYRYTPTGFEDAKDSKLWVLPSQYTYALPNVTRSLSNYWDSTENDEFIKGYSFFFNQVDVLGKPIWTPDQIMHTREPNLKLKQTEFFFDLV